MMFDERAASKHALPVIPGATPARVTNCDGCGVCCREQILPPFLDEIDFIPKELQEQVYAARRIEAELLVMAKGCIWWDASTRKCIHHEHRPNVCREFEIGSEDCLDYRQRHGVA